MKRFALHFALVVVAALGAFSCQKSDLQQGVSLGSYSLFARVVDTKIEFTNNTSEGIYLDWELGDTFSVYAEDDGSYVGDYYCVDTDLEAFSPKAGVTLTSGAAYTAIYPAVDNSDGELSLDDARARDLTSVQNGDAIANLDAACYMEGSFTYSSESDITVGFEHQMAVMSFTFISAQRPDHLIFDNGSDSYTVNYSTISPTITNSEGNDYYTSHIMIEPCEAAERTLCFALYDSDGELYDYRIVTTSKAYEAGVRYTAPVSDLLPWLGSGTESDPYQISNADQLRQLSTNVNAGNQYSGEYFIMTTSIDLGFDDPAWRYGTDSTYFEKAENKFTPIGNSEEVSFRGTFDGGGYEVSGLYVDEAGGYAGLFGYVYGATIKNLGVTGVISGTKNVGGIVGYGFGPVTIENCYNKALVSSGDGGNLGGILGYVLAFNSYGSIINCYNSREVSSSGSNVGGIVGYSSYCNVTNCYNRGEISSSSDNVGGIVGYGDNLGTISICYNSAEVSGGDNVGSILGTRKYSSGLLMTTVTNCYYLELDSSSDDCAEEVSDQRMKSADFVVDLNNLVYTYNQSASTKAYGWAQVTDSYPVLDPSVEVVYTYDLEYDSSTDTYLIHNEYGLKAFADLVNGNANTCDATVSGPSFGIAIPSINGLLTADIDLSAICSSSEGNWEPIGKSTSVLFSGTFDGGGYSISGLYIDASSSSNLGLFGCVGAYGVVKNISISGNITGFKDVGGLAGVNNGTIINCYNNAWITGTEYIGGIVGWNFGAITNCYDISGYISGKSSVGGIVGCNQGGVVTNCYKSSSLMANSTGGGIVGYMYSGTVTNCYYDCSWTYGYGGTSSDDDSATKLMSTDDMQEPSFALTLYNNAYSYNLNNSTAPQACAWKVGDNGYPALAYNTTPTNLLFSGGEGTKDYPYLISTSDDLRELSTIVNLGLKDFSEQYLEMTADIDLEGYNMANEFTAIGSTATPFKGNFNGNGHSISDIYILAIPMALDTGEGNYQGLFGYISGATITDVHMVGGYISGYSYVGAVVGQAYYSSVTNCSSSTSVFGTVAVASGQESRAAHVGGVVGQAYNSTVSGCCYTGNEVSGYEKTGGVVGSAISGSTITNCYNRANYVTSTQNAGGVVGYLLESYLYNSYSATNDISSGLYIGGVAGSISSSTVHNCYFDITLLPNWAAVSHFDTSGTSISNATGWSTENMTDGKFAEILGGSWKEDTGGINDGYPILTWQ